MQKERGLSDMKTYVAKNAISNRKPTFRQLFTKIGGYFSAIVIVYGIWLFFTLKAEAYIDPSAMTYIIQAVAGVIIAIGAALGIYIRKAKRKVQDKLGIDETKEMESDDIVVNK